MFFKMARISGCLLYVKLGLHHTNSGNPMLAGPWVKEWHSVAGDWQWEVVELLSGIVLLAFRQLHVPPLFPLTNQLHSL